MTDQTLNPYPSRGKFFKILDHIRKKGEKEAKFGYRGGVRVFLFMFFVLAIITASSTLAGASNCGARISAERSRWRIYFGNKSRAQSESAILFIAAAPRHSGSTKDLKCTVREYLQPRTFNLIDQKKKEILFPPPHQQKLNYFVTK